MSIKYLSGIQDTEPYCVLVDTVTNTAFGPVFDNVAVAKKFVFWLGDKDPRKYVGRELELFYAQFLRGRPFAILAHDSSRTELVDG